MKISEIVCHVCKNDSSKKALYRISEIGKLPSIWACEEHMEIEVDKEVKELVSIFEETNK